MLVILKNNWRRLMQRKGYLVVSIILTVVCVASAIVFTGNEIIKSNVAWVTQNNVQQGTELDGYHVTYLDTVPANYQLLVGRYDAIIVENKGNVEIKTYKNKKYKENLEKALVDPSASCEAEESKRGVGTNIIGYIIMVLLMQGFLYGRLFAEDIETHMIKRVATTSFTFLQYLLGNSLFICAIIFIPSYLTIVICHLLNIDIAISLVSYAFFIFLISFLSTAFCLFLEAYVPGTGNANTLGSSVIVLSSIMSGCFRPISDSSGIINKVLNIVPQKDLVDFVDAFEKQHFVVASWLQISYVILLSLIFLCLAFVKLSRDYIYKV